MTRPNVLLVTTDHWSAGLLGAAGHRDILTPTLDTLAASGTRFSRAYSECPVCIPARRTLMTGTTPRTHGDRTYSDKLPMPSVPTLAQTFRDHGYQAYAVGKLHVYPQRSRIGFDDVILSEEGRILPSAPIIDDYEAFLAERGFPGQMFTSGMSNNEYVTRPWHLPEDCHPTNWATREMCRMIKRRDPARPALWYLSYVHPHPPLWPLQCYLDMYGDLDVEHVLGEWSHERDALPSTLRGRFARWMELPPRARTLAVRAFYALCTHIDHQLRVVVGTLAEEKLLNDTVILFTADHGDMLGQHGLTGKRYFYEASAGIPMILSAPKSMPRVNTNHVDDRLVGLQDVMPTLLDLCDLPIPHTVEGKSMIGPHKRGHLYGEMDGDGESRMIHTGRYKLIYYPTGNAIQLFDLHHDPAESRNIAEDANHREVRDHLTKLLISELYGDDLQWLKDGRLVGLPDAPYVAHANRALSGQRGTHWPPPSPPAQ